MGRGNKAYYKDLHQQAYERLTGMLALGDSKKSDKAYDREHGTDLVSSKIYMSTTYETYWKHIKYFLKWIKTEHPDCKTLKKARKYVNEWLSVRVKEGKSAWTIQTEEAALNKLYNIKKDDSDKFQAPQRKKEDIVRSRGAKERDKHFSEKKNEELVNFCRGCGFRRNVLEKLRGKDLYDRDKIEIALQQAKVNGDRKMIVACTDALKTFPDKEYFILHYNDKGGKTRIAPIVGDHVEKIVERMKNTKPDELVWRYVPNSCDVHGYRAPYATELYKQYARPVEELNYKNKIRCSDGTYKSEIYVCRGDEKGKRLDRVAVGMVSIALGHNREDTAITNYIQNL